MRHQPYLFDARSAGWPRTTGWERYAREVATRLAKTDPLVRVRTTGSPAMTSRLWQDAVATPWASRPARVVHFPTLPPTPLIRPTSKVVYTVHDLTWWRWRETASLLGRRYYAPLALAALRTGAHIVTDTHAVAGELREAFGLSEDRLTVVPLGVGLPTPSGRRPRDRPYFLAVGTVEPRKNLGLLAEAFDRSGISVTHDLVVVGRQGWGQLPPGVHTVTGLDDGDIADMYSGATALVLPSLYEGFGLPAVEAMRIGTPVICSDIPVLREVTGGMATYVAPRDVDGWVAALRAGRNNRTVPPSAATWARDTYSWDVTASALSALYRRVDASNGAASQ